MVTPVTKSGSLDARKQITLAWSVASASHVRLRIVSILGEIIATIVDEDLPAGSYRSVWNAANVPSGMYYYTLQAGTSSAVRKMMLLR